MILFNIILEYNSHCCRIASLLLIRLMGIWTQNPKSKNQLIFIKYYEKTNVAAVGTIEKLGLNSSSLKLFKN